MKDGPEILVLSSERNSSFKKMMEQELNKLGPIAIYGNYNQLMYDSGFKNGSTKLTFNGFDLRQFKVIYFRLIGSRWEIITLINKYLKERIEKGKVKLIDPMTISLKRYYGCKLTQHLVLKEAGLPVPKTIWGNLEKLWKKGPQRIGFPLVIKRSGGSHGDNVYLAKSKETFREILDNLKPQEKRENKIFIVQEFIPNQSDLRIEVLGNKVLAAVERKAPEGDFRNNVSRGGKAYAVKDLSPEIEKIALKATKAVDLSVAGVDIVKRETDNKPFIFEVNRAPQFIFMEVTGVNVPHKIAQYLLKLREETN